MLTFFLHDEIKCMSVDADNRRKQTESVRSKISILQLLRFVLKSVFKNATETLAYVLKRRLHFFCLWEPLSKEELNNNFIPRAKSINI